MKLLVKHMHFKVTKSKRRICRWVSDEVNETTFFKFTSISLRMFFFSLLTLHVYTKRTGHQGHFQTLIQGLTLCNPWKSLSFNTGLKGRSKVFKLSEKPTGAFKKSSNSFVSSCLWYGNKIDLFHGDFHKFRIAFYDAIWRNYYLVMALTIPFFSADPPHRSLKNLLK